MIRAEKNWNDLIRRWTNERISGLPNFFWNSYSTGGWKRGKSSAPVKLCTRTGTQYKNDYFVFCLCSVFSIAQHVISFNIYRISRRICGLMSEIHWFIVDALFSWTWIASTIHNVNDCDSWIKETHRRPSRRRRRCRWCHFNTTIHSSENMADARKPNMSLLISF